MLRTSALIALALSLGGCKADETPRPDAASVDAGPAPDDAGPAPGDAGPAPDDAGPAPDDAGPAPDDAGPAPDDAGPAPDDAGPAPDAGAAAVCGDRRITAPEECDDGNTRDGDGCDGRCRLETSATCGDGTVDIAAGEECDDGGTRDGDGCDGRCRIEAPPACGDGTLDLAAGEECDDGDTTPGDGCSPTCQLELVGAFCGDDVDDPGEVCDDGNVTHGDGCNPTCNLTGTTTLFVGAPGMPGSRDGIRGAARVGGFGTLAADATSLWLAQGATAPATPSLRRITIATGEVTTVATVAGAEGIATDGTSTVYVAGGSPPQIQAISTSAPFTVRRVTGGTPASRCMATGCYRDGDPSTATFGGIRGLTWFRGFLWIVDPEAATVRRLDPSTGAVTTVAGSPFNISTTPVDGVGPAARFESPRYIVSDNSGLLYVSDTNGAAIRVVDARTFAVTTFAGNGTPGHVDGTGGGSGAARIHRPRGISADGASIYWVEFDAHTVRQGVRATLDVGTLAGFALTSGYAEGTGIVGARFAQPFSIAYHFPSNSLFVLDGGNAVIRRIR